MFKVNSLKGGVGVFSPLCIWKMCPIQLVATSPPINQPVSLMGSLCLWVVFFSEFVLVVSKSFTGKRRVSYNAADKRNRIKRSVTPRETGQPEKLYQYNRERWICQ